MNLFEKDEIQIRKFRSERNLYITFANLVLTIVICNIWSLLKKTKSVDNEIVSIKLTK